MTSCPPPEVVQAAAAGVLAPPLATRVTAHVTACAICRALVEALDDPSVGDLTRKERDRIRRRIRSGLAPASTRSMPRVWRAAAVAGWLGASIVIGWWWWTTPRPPLRPQSVLVPDASSLVSASAAPIRETDVPDEWRDLTLALAPYRQRDLSGTVQNLADFIERHPTSARGHFYLGVSSLLLNRNRVAVRALEQAERLGRGDPLLARQAAWHLAIGYWRTGQLDRARVRLTVLCDTPGEFSRTACAAGASLGFATLSGTVTNQDGEPIERATIGQYIAEVEGTQMVLTRTAFASTSDGSGRYAVVGVPERRGSHLILRAAKPGYFTASGGTLLLPDMQADFRLRPWTFGSIDDVMSGTLEASDYCGNINELCRQLAVVAPSAGVLELSLATEAPMQMDVWVEGPDGEVRSPAPGGPLRVASPVEAGATYQITVVSWVPDSPPFELTMQLR